MILRRWFDRWRTNFVIFSVFWSHDNLVLSFIRIRYRKMLWQSKSIWEMMLPKPVCLVLCVSFGVVRLLAVSRFAYSSFVCVCVWGHAVCVPLAVCVCTLLCVCLRACGVCAPRCVCVYPAVCVCVFVCALCVWDTHTVRFVCVVCGCLCWCCVHTTRPTHHTARFRHTHTHTLQTHAPTHNSAQTHCAQHFALTSHHVTQLHTGCCISSWHFWEFCKS
jgi:hypothetical protein